MKCYIFSFAILWITIPSYLIAQNVMPLYPGGEPAMMTYIHENISYPDWEFEKKVEGEVRISFQIDTNGHVFKTKIRKGFTKGLDKEALRVVNSMPKWTPGSGSAATIAIHLNISFTINHDSWAKDLRKRRKKNKK